MIKVVSARDQIRLEDGILAGDIDWSITKKTLVGGLQQGVEILQVDNGQLQFDVIMSRGMSVSRVDCGGVKLGWDSPVQEIVHPQYVDLQEAGGLGWLSGFNEWMARCGVSFAGHPGEDDGRLLTLHGKIGNLPASEIEIIIEEEPRLRLRIRGLVSERMFKFGCFDLWTEISTEVGSRKIRFEDQLKNESEYEQEYQLIYHSNYGPPLLGPNAKFVAPIQEVFPFNEDASAGLETFDTFAGPERGFGEQVYCMRLHADQTNATTVMLQNTTGQQGVAMHYDTSTLPAFTLWKNTDTLSDGYVTGLEPGTGFPFNRAVERANKRLPALSPKSEVGFSIETEVLMNSSEVSKIRERVDRLQRGILPMLNAQPPTI